MIIKQGFPIQQSQCSYTTHTKVQNAHILLMQKYKMFIYYSYKSTKCSYTTHIKVYCTISQLLPVYLYKVIDGLCIPYPIYSVLAFQFKFLLVCSSTILLFRLLMDRASLSSLHVAL